MSQQRRPIGATEGLRQTRRSMGDGTLGGRVRIATPYSSRALFRGRPAVREVVGGISPDGGGGSGQTVSVVAGAAGFDFDVETAVAWQGYTSEGHGFDLDFPTETIRVARNGYYTVKPSIGNANPFGVTVRVYVNGDLRYGPDLDPSWACPFATAWSSTAHGILCTPGDLISVTLQFDVGSQSGISDEGGGEGEDESDVVIDTLHVDVELVEPIGLGVGAPQPGLSDWTTAGNSSGGTLFVPMVNDEGLPMDVDVGDLLLIAYAGTRIADGICGGVPREIDVPGAALKRVQSHSAGSCRRGDAALFAKAATAGDISNGLEVFNNPMSDHCRWLVAVLKGMADFTMHDGHGPLASASVTTTETVTHLLTSSSRRNTGANGVISADPDPGDDAILLEGGASSGRFKLWATDGQTFDVLGSGRVTGYLLEMIPA